MALYAGEGAKTDGVVKFANSDPRMILFFVTWLRAFFAVDESRLRLRLYLHQGLDLAEAEQFWSALTDIPLSQFGAAYRAVPDSTIRSTKHVRGLRQRRLRVQSHPSSDHGSGGGAANLARPKSGVAQLAEHAAVNRVVVGSSPTPGARRVWASSSVVRAGDS